MVYLRGDLIALASSGSAISQFQDPALTYQQTVSFLAQMPQNLRAIETCREAATMVMLISVALLVGSGVKQRWGAFLWTFALWDITYYAGLWATLRWPASLCNYDVLFLIPVPWYAQVWFPLLVSALSMLAVALSRSNSHS